MFIFYDILFILFCLLYVPHVIIRRKWHNRFMNRFGFFKADEKKIFEGKKNIWIHAVSVGEVLAVLDIIQDLKKIYPHHRIVCSTVTITGYKLALEKLSKKDAVIYAPFDFSLVVKKYIRFIKPVIYIATETEIWPNLFHFLKKMNVPIIIINGRISTKSFKKYRLIKFFMRPVLSCVSTFCMQSYADLHRIKCLGADETRGKMVGNLKFATVEHLNVEEKYTGFDSDNDLLIAGSTHPGEEEMIINVYKKLVAEFKNLRLVIVPRHIERAEEISQIVQNEELKPVSYSELKKDKLSADHVLVVDQIGILKNLYFKAKLVFVGKSFKVGGAQNMIEPLAFGKPTFVGPRTENFTDVMRIFLEEKVIFQVETPDEMTEAMRGVLAYPEIADELGLKAKAVIERNLGAKEKTIKAIRYLMDVSLV